MLELPLVPNGYPLTPICDSSGQDCYTPQAKEPQFLIITHQPELSGNSYIQETNAWMPYWQQAQTKIHSSTNTQSWSSLNTDLQLEVKYPVEVSIYPEQLLFSSGKFTALGRSSYTGEYQAKAVIQSNDGLNWDLLTPVLKTQPIVLDNGTFQNYVPTELFAGLFALHVTVFPESPLAPLVAVFQ